MLTNLTLEDFESLKKERLFEPEEIIKQPWFQEFTNRYDQVALNTLGSIVQFGLEIGVILERKNAESKKVFNEIPPIF